MLRKLLLSVTLAVGTGLLPLPVQAQSTPIRGPVEFRTDRNPDEISDYVSAVDRRLQRGRYDRIDSKDRVWMLRQIAALKAELALIESRAAAPPRLQILAGEFELGVIRIEEGSIICRVERRTGTRFEEDRCYTQKRMREDEERSRDTLREWKRPQAIGGGTGANS
jgi:hypothetical protein